MSCFSCLFLATSVLLIPSIHATVLCDHFIQVGNQTVPAYYECPNWAYCCGDGGCCERYHYHNPFWTLWYFWLIIIFLMLFCGVGTGGYWYNNYYRNGVVEVLPVYVEEEPMVVRRDSYQGPDHDHDETAPGDVSVTKVIEVATTRTPPPA